MHRAVEAWEKLKEVYGPEAEHQTMRTLLIMCDTKDYEFLDCLLIQVEPAEIPKVIVPLLRSTFAARRYLIAWDQLRDKTWNMRSDKQWRHTMRGLDPTNCARYTAFIEAGGYAGVLPHKGE
jgi:hypothetical protein